jgi:hypothetical protein
VSAKHLTRDPQHRRGHDDWWWYEQADGICVVVEPKPFPHAQTRSVTIPWARIRSALKRKDRKP